MHGLRQVDSDLQGDFCFWFMTESRSLAWFYFILGKRNLLRNIMLVFVHCSSQKYVCHINRCVQFRAGNANMKTKFSGYLSLAIYRRLWKQHVQDSWKNYEVFRSCRTHYIDSCQDKTINFLIDQFCLS